MPAGASERGEVAVRDWVKWITGAAAIGMFVVLVMGAAVTSTGSAEGCGRSWPLCNGRFIPEFAVSTAIEFSHRAVTGVEGLFILGAAAGMWLRFRARPEARLLTLTMIAFLLLQAGLGAWAVLYPQTKEVLALHFGVSLIAFASTLLAYLFALQAGGPADRLRDVAIPAALRRGVWALAVYTYVVVYIGAYVRHTDSSLACRDWPLCGGAVVPAFTGPVAIVFAHRLAALGGVVAITGVLAWTHRYRDKRPDLYRAAWAALGFVLLQSASGALVVLTGVSLFSALAHSGVMALLFGSISYLCFQVVPRPVMLRRHADESAPVAVASPAR